MSSYQEWEEWKDSFLARRGLSKPDGRPLYKYRISIDEFESLKTLMTGSSLALRIKGKPDDDYNHYGFNGLFVLYASEYFRKEYSEIRWYFVHKSIGITLLVNPSPKLYACIESGLSEWGRCPNQSISDAGGMKWLGSLILEGGLQLSMLADKGCHLGNFLNRFIKKTEYRRPSAPDIAKWIEHSKDELQKTYQNKTFYDLLAELVWRVLHFKAVARITSPVDIIGQLDAYDQDWRDEFPLRIDDDQTTALIETLVKEAIKIPRVFQFPVVRELQKYGEDWQLKSSITLPDQLDISSLRSTFFAEDDAQPDLPRKMEICLDHGKQCCLLRRIIGSEAYRPISNIRWELFGIDATTEHVLRLNSDGQVWSASATKGEALDPDLPWVFGVEQDNFRFMRQGSGSIAAMEGIIVIPDDWNADDALRQVGKVPSLDRTVYQFSGPTLIADGQGNNYQIRTGRTNAAEQSYAMQGDRIWFGFLNPSLAYRGLPKLYTIDVDGYPKNLGRPEWRVLGSQTTTSAEPLGPVLATWLTDSGDVRYRAKMVILPLSAKISYEFVDHQTAKIRLKKWKAARAYRKTDDIVLSSTVKNDGDDLEITLKYRGAKYPPEYVDLEVEWDHSPIPVQLHLPLPLRGARAFDHLGQDIEQGENIAVQQLAGVRLLALNGSQGNHPHLELEFELGHISAPAVRTTIAGLQAELKLSDYAGEIHRLLSTDDRPDASVKVSLRVEGKELRFRVSRYTCHLEKDGETVRLDSTSRKKLDIEQLAALPVMALQLEYPGHDPIKLQPILSQGVATGSWFFDQQMRDPGSWLIYPANDAQVIFRPVVWYLPGDTEATSDLGQTLGIDDDKQRQRALDAVIVALAEDYNHPDWSEVEHLVQKVGHLPLTFLDIWRRFARSPVGMAALAMRWGYMSADFISRFDKELPFAWETVPYVSWVKAMNLLQNQCKIYGEKASETVFHSHLSGRVDKLTLDYPALNFLLQIARSDAINEISQELNFLRQQAPSIAELTLFSQENGHIQRLPRDNEVWPEDFIGPVNEFRSTSKYKMFLCQDRFGYKDSVINFPILLAFQAATEMSSKWFDNPEQIYSLRTHQYFDQDWFTEAYNWTIARCLASGLINLVEQK